MTQHITQEGLELIASFEGFKANAYPDPGTGGKPWTIGYGHTKGVLRGQVITKAQAMTFLRQDVASAEAIVNAAPKAQPLTDAQFSALVSLVFNAGSAPMKGQIGKLLAAGRYDGIPAKMMEYTKAGGKVMKGLVRRRTAEVELWHSDLDDDADEPVPVAEKVPSKPITQSKTIGAGVGAVALGGITQFMNVDTAIERAGKAKDAGLFDLAGSVFTNLIHSPSTVLLTGMGICVAVMIVERVKNKGAFL